MPYFLYFQVPLPVAGSLEKNNLGQEGEATAKDSGSKPISVCPPGP